MIVGNFAGAAEGVRKHVLIDRAVSAWQRLGKSKATPENRVLSRFHTGSTLIRPSKREHARQGSVFLRPLNQRLKSLASSVPLPDGRCSETSPVFGQ